MLVCKILLLARALGLKAYAAARPSAHATIGYLVYKPSARTSKSILHTKRLLIENQGARLDFDCLVYFLIIRLSYVNDLWECGSKIDQCISYADFE